VKRDGVYGDVSWGALSERVKLVAAALVGMGVKPGDRVGILSPNRQEFIEADFAILSVGAITVALHAPLSGAQVRTQFADAAPVVVFVANAEQREKLLGYREFVLGLRHIVAFDADRCDSDTRAYSSIFTEEARTGLHPQVGTRFAGEVEERIAAVMPEDVAAILYTSGTTGESKGVMLTHNNFVSNIRACERHFPAEVEGESVTLAYLPFSHVYGRTCDLYYGLAAGRIVALAESIDTLAQNLQEVRPHYLSGVPRVYEKRVEAARALSETGHKDALRQILGGRIRYCGSGGAALSPDVARFFFDSGVPIYQGYGLTETSPVISFSNQEHNKIGAVGVLLDGVEVKIAEDGEILSRGPHIMKGYWNKPEATAEVIDPEGWFHSGDVGYLDDEGFLRITDRKKDILVTANGKNVAPQQIEGLLCFDPYIEQACVYGDSRRFLTALLVPAESTLQAWAREHIPGDRSLPELIALPEVHDLYEERVEQALKDLAPCEQVRRFLLLPDLFSFYKGEMTVTAKLRRKPILERYREQLEALYED
jgi:long-chain acyl-CoA synthetase